MAEEREAPNQDLYDIFVAQGVKMAVAFADKLTGKASVEVLGNTLFDIVNKVETQGAKNGVQFGLDVIIHGSNEILGHLIELSQVQISEEQIKQAIGIAVGRWVQNAIKTGKMTAEQLQGLAQQGQQSLQQQGDQVNV
jgi:transcriptional regulator